MSLIQGTLEACRRLDSMGWRDFLLRVSDLDIRQADAAALAAELARPLRRIDRTAPGFTGFALEGTRAVEPGNPAWSLLFHAVAAPALGAGQVRGFPSPDDIEAVENYVYGVQPPSIQDLAQRAGGAPLAIVAYAAEYRPAGQTVHGKHADMCFARTGVARIGTAEAKYAAAGRGYISLGESPRDLHVIPCRYSAYIAVQLTGEAGNFGPLTFRQGGLDAEGNPVTPDNQRKFWVPLHKIFNGGECIRGRHLNLRWATGHRNEKLRRIHLYLLQLGFTTANSPADLQRPPFVLPESELAETAATAGGSLLVKPLARPLVEQVILDDRRVTLEVLPGSATPSASFHIPSRAGGGRSSPEYVYVKQKVDGYGAVHDLNRSPDVVREINLGGFPAQHFLDRTGDGWIQPQCDGLSLDVAQELAAYSILAAPTLYPSVKSIGIFEWWMNSVPPDLQAPSSRTSRARCPWSRSRMRASPPTSPSGARPLSP